MTHTAVFQVPQTAGPRAVLEVRVPNRPVQFLRVRGATLRLGRAADNEIVLLDERVSRHHGRLVARQGTLVYTDLGSTNGSFLNGTPIREIALGPGDVLQVGDSVLIVRAET